MSKEPTAPPKPEPPRYQEGKGGPTSGQPPRHAENPNQPPGSPSTGSGGKPQPKGQSQKSQIAQYFRSQGRQPDDVILDINGMQLRLSDLDG